MGIIGEKQHLNFHFGHPGNKELRDIPKGRLAIMVGQGEEQERFVIPVMYMAHPLFKQLLKEAEEEYGFHHDGPLAIPCHVHQFRHVQGLIDQDHRHHHHHHHHVCCFSV
ncbi:hypothetical protein V6N13_025630 [Hibiscus sabdariffa]